MDFGQYGIAQRYDLVALGILGGPPLKAASIVAETAWENLQAASVAFIVYDDVTRQAVINAAARRLKVGKRYPLHLAAVSQLREPPERVKAIDLTLDVPLPVEFAEFGMASMLAAPVFGPDKKSIGVLAAFDTKPRAWSQMHHWQLENMAYLINQEVMLHASFATLELMASERFIFDA